MNSSYMRDEMFGHQHVDSISSSKHNHDHFNTAINTNSIRTATTNTIDQNNLFDDAPPVITSSVKPKKKRDGSNLRKAPGAPKRFKSSYIMFFMAKQKEIKSEIGQGASVGEISKRSSEKWKALSKDERAYWDKKAEEDKERYNQEKEKYTGPWQVPWKRAKKNPNAPKRPMSAFLFFSQERRRAIKEANPKMRNTEISRVLGGMWQKASPEERAPHIEREASERKKYKIEIAKWREQEATRSREDIDIDQVSSGENSKRNLSSHHKSSPVASEAPPSPLHVHLPRSGSPPAPSYYPQQGSYADYYPPPQNYNVPPQYSSFNYPPPPGQPVPPPPPQSHNYYHNYAPPPPPIANPEFGQPPRQYQDYPIARADSWDEPRYRNHTISPAPTQYGSYYSNLSTRSDYGVSQHAPSSRADPTAATYPEDYPPPS